MLEIAKEIPVTFEPHWADAWMVWVTLASVAVSAGIAGVAIWSGVQSRKAAESATRIAEDSARIARESLTVAKEGAERDQQRIDRAARSEVAFAMLRVLVLMDNYAWAPPPGPERGKMWDDIRSSLDDALARIDVYESMHVADTIREWFDRNTDDLLTYADTENVESPFRSGVHSLRQQVSRWNAHELSASELRDVSLDISWLKAPEPPAV